jgi:hypothetical protein
MAGSLSRRRKCSARLAPGQSSRSLDAKGKARAASLANGGFRLGAPKTQKAKPELRPYSETPAARRASFHSASILNSKIHFSR